MRILTFSTLYPHAARPNYGVFVETRLRKLLESGKAEATVLAPVPWFPFRHACFGEYALHALAPRHEIRNGIEVLHPRYPVLPKIGMTAAPFLLYKAMLPVLQRLLRSYRFQLIDAHYFYPDGVAAVMLGRRLGKPVVVTARGTDINLVGQHRWPRRMIRWAAHSAAGVVAVSQALKERLVELGVPRERVEVLRNGVDLQLFRPLERPGLATQHKTLLSVGNLLDFKGHGLVIEALRLLADCAVEIVGTGPDRASFEALAHKLGVEKRVRFVGALGPQALRERYASAHALILASSREGWPNVVLEALACGTPVIATRVGGTPEIVTSPQAGLLVRERTPRAVAEAVRQLFSHYPDRRATRRHAEQFKWAPTTSGQLRLFERILAGNPQPDVHVRHLRTPAV